MDLFTIQNMNKILNAACLTLALSIVVPAKADPVGREEATDATTKQPSHLEDLAISGDVVNEITSPNFVCTTAHQFKDGEKIKVMVSEAETWSVETTPLQVGAKKINYPVIGTVKCSDNDFASLVPAVFKATLEIKAGTKTKSGGYQIEAQRSIHKGESVAVLIVGDLILSVDAVKNSTGTTGDAPALIAVKEGSPPAERDLALKAWRVEAERFNK